MSINTYGYSPAGKRFCDLKSGRQQGRINMIAGYRDSQLIAPFTVEGACCRTTPVLKTTSIHPADIQFERGDIPPNPYLGLSAFGEKDAAFFFGREKFTHELFEIAQHQQLVAVIGASGSGKSSVVFAGLIPKLRVEGIWLIESLRPKYQVGRDCKFTAEGTQTYDDGTTVPYKQFGVVIRAGKEILTIQTRESTNQAGKYQRLSDY